ncbi:hypothetical protein K443DRAFT_116757, partial [Laccaria amethystina LaAM-08-1]
LTSPLPSLDYPFGLGITRGTYDEGRGLLTCVTAALSADIPCIDALPYRPAVQSSSEKVRICCK